MAHWSDVFEYSQYSSLTSYVRWNTDDTAPKQTGRRDAHYIVNEGKRKMFKLTMMLTVYFMYSDDGKLSLKEKILLQKHFMKNTSILDRNDKLAIKRWIKVGVEFKAMTQYIKQYKYNWEMVAFIIEGFANNLGDDRYIEIIQETKNKLEPYRDLLMVNDL